MTFPSNETENRVVCITGKDLKKKLKRYAFENETSMSDIILELVKDFLKKQEQRINYGNTDKDLSRARANPIQGG